MAFLMGHTHAMQPVELPDPPNELHSKLRISANIGSTEAWGTVLESSARPLQDCNFAYSQGFDGKRGMGSFHIELFDNVPQAAITNLVCVHRNSTQFTTAQLASW